MELLEPQAGVWTLELTTWGRSGDLEADPAAVEYQPHWSAWFPSVPGQITGGGVVYPETKFVYTGGVGATDAFTLESISSPRYTGRSFVYGGDRFAFYAITVRVRYPQWYVGSVGGAKIKYPGELHDVHVQWLHKPFQSFLGGEVFTGGVLGQFSEEDIKSNATYTPLAQMRQKSIGATISGKDLAASVELEQLKPGEELYGVGWGMFAGRVEHQGESNSVIGGTGQAWEYTAFTTDTDLAVRIPDGVSAVYLRRVYFTRKGQVWVQPDFQTNLTTNTRYIDIATPEQRTPLARNNSLLETAGNAPVIYYDRNLPAVEKRAITFRSYYDTLHFEDVSPDPLTPGSGVGMAVYNDGSLNGQWWRDQGTSLGGWQPYVHWQNFAEPAQMLRRKDHAWPSASVTTSVTTSVPISVTAMRVNPHFCLGFATWSYYSWHTAPVPPRPWEIGVDLKFTRTPADYDACFTPTVESTAEHATVATLARMPFCPMPLLVERSHLYLTDGVSGCWESDNLGETWSAVAGWAPAFESPVLPLHCLSANHAWFALGLRLGEVGENPTVLCRRSYDRGQHWEDEVEVGELNKPAVWGCSIAALGARLVIANSAKLFAYSDDDGATWEVIDASN